MGNCFFNNTYRLYLQTRNVSLSYSFQRLVLYEIRNYEMRLRHAGCNVSYFVLFALISYFVL
jgi:hypothetical protein